MDYKSEVLAYWPDAFFLPRENGDRIGIPWGGNTKTVGHGKGEANAWHSAYCEMQREKEKK
jgi:hypothetical protein